MSSILKYNMKLWGQEMLQFLTEKNCPVKAKEQKCIFWRINEILYINADRVLLKEIILCFRQYLTVVLA